MSLAMVVALKAISRNVARNQVISQKMILIDRNSLLPQIQAEMNFASTLPQTEAEFFDEKGLPEGIQSSSTTAVPAYRQYVYVLKKIQGNPSNAILSLRQMV